MIRPPLGVATAVPIWLAVRKAAAERRTITRLQEAGANTSERAILLDESDRFAPKVHRRLRDAGALVSAGNDRYYFNAAAYEAYRGRERRRALIVIAVVTAFAAALLLLKDQL